jgi:transposase
MGKASSVDLRGRVLAAIDGGLSTMQAHKTFQVRRSTIDDWLRGRETTGSVHGTPRQPGAGRGLAHHHGCAAFAQRHQHSTLEQMRLAWEQQPQQRVRTMSVSSALRHQGDTRKKRAPALKSDEQMNGTSSPNREPPYREQIAVIWMQQAGKTRWTTQMGGASKASVAGPKRWNTARSACRW